MDKNNYKSEIFIGLVAPVGVDLDYVEIIIEYYLKQFGYKVEEIRLSDLIEKIDGLKTQMFWESESEYKRIDSHMTAGNEARKLAKSGNILARLALYKIYNNYHQDESLNGCKAYIFRSLKHPDEVSLLRDVYGNGFFLLGVTSSYKQRLKHLTDQKGISLPDTKRLIKRDECEESEFGQHTRDVFHLSDGFVDIDAINAEEQIGRFFDLIFGNPYITPNKDEYSIFLAFAASLRSADLSRQVGAVVVSKTGEVISTGANDVPRYGGGLYWADDGELDQRDYKWGYDSNEKQKNDIILEIMKRTSKKNNNRNNNRLLNKGKKLLKNTGVSNITEYGRAVHAEMEAILSCTRSGISPRNATLYTITFPCHNCTKHIIAAGITRVVFIEPYPKSLAKNLYRDSIVLENESKNGFYENKVRFQPFVGIGPRRFIDLFSMNIFGGPKKGRKVNGKTIKWNRSTSSIRLPISPISYIDREMFELSELYNIMKDNLKSNFSNLAQLEKKVKEWPDWKKNHGLTKSSNGNGHKALSRALPKKSSLK